MRSCTLGQAPLSVSSIVPSRTIAGGLSIRPHCHDSPTSSRYDHTHGDTEGGEGVRWSI
jgi:hypothetical protein